MGMRIGPFTRSWDSLALLIRSLHTGRAREWRERGEGGRDRRGGEGSRREEGG